ncbi:MAG: formate dehydrogenase assembly factor FdhD, partial [Flavobacteriales bacterium]
MTPKRTYEGVRTKASKQQAVSDALVVEVPLQIMINGEPWSMTMQTPGDELD